MRVLILLTLLSALTVFGLAGPGATQSLGSLLSAGTTEAPPVATDTSPISEIMRQARENGLSVVVIDDQGKLATGADTAADKTGDAAADSSMRIKERQDALIKFRTALFERFLQLPANLNEVLFILRATSPDGTIWAFGKALIYSLLLFGAGMLFEQEIFGKRMMRKFVTSRVLENPEGYREKMPFLMLRFVVGVGGILVSMAVAYILGSLIFGPLQDSAMQFTVSLINIGYFSCRFVAGLWRMILSPYLAQYRIPPLTTPEARRLHRWLWVLATFDIVAILFGIWIAELGLNYDVFALLSSLLSGFIVLVNILMVLVNRRAISMAIRNRKTAQDVSWVLRTLSKIWAPIVIAYVIYAWFELTYNLVLGKPSTIPLIAGAYGILMTIIVVYGVINFFIERSFERMRMLRNLNAEVERADDQDIELTQEQLAQKEALEPRRAIRTFEELAQRVAGILAFVAGVYAFFYIWDNQSTKMVESAADQLLDIMVIVFIGYIIYHIFRIWIDNKIADEQGEEVEAVLGDEGGAASSASRLATLLPLFRNFMLIVVVVTIALIVLMQIGINVGPLFAGAGVVGVAVGFGSQALVRDIFSGGFFLFDDAFRKGEYLDVGGVKGTVEKISVRSFQLRHHLGALHTIPFGEIQVMTNYSRDWVIMKLPLRVTYDTDVEKVRKLIKKLGVELLDDPVIGPDFIQPLKSQGVIEMQDSAMIIRVKFMTKPGDQWIIRKRVYEDIRALFEREGIKFAHKEVTVRLADGKHVDQLTEEEKKTVTAAAQASIEEDLMDGEPSEGDDR
jgi:small-conductance mechanosensitive channel